MAYIPCDDCKYRTERHEGFRIFLGCSDKEKRKGFHENNFTYRHQCDNYKKGEEADHGTD